MFQSCLDLVQRRQVFLFLLSPDTGCRLPPGRWHDLGPGGQLHPRQFPRGHQQRGLCVNSIPAAESGALGQKGDGAQPLPCSKGAHTMQREDVMSHPLHGADLPLSRGTGSGQNLPEHQPGPVLLRALRCGEYPPLCAELSPHLWGWLGRLGGGSGSFPTFTSEHHLSLRPGLALPSQAPLRC